MTSITSTLRRNVDNLSQFVALSLLAIVILMRCMAARIQVTRGLKFSELHPKLL